MSRKVPTIPPPTGKNDQDVLRAVAGALGYIMAQQQTPIRPLPATATLSDVIAKINEVIARLQAQ